jgi:predicted GNAT family N-acyltransferase
MRIEKFNYQDKPLFDKAFEIRVNVFVEEQKVDCKFEKEFEEEATHYLLFDDNNNPIATARWRETTGGIKLERFAILRKYRKKDYGQIILEFILNDISSLDKYVYLHAQAAAAEFYRKNGFMVQGNVFMEADIEHYKMTLKK